MATVGNIIYGADYNAVQVKVTQVLGTGSPYGPGTASPNYGYNQALGSSPVSANAVVTHNQFQLLADDVNKIALHQTNANFSGYSTVYANTGNLVSAANLNTLDTAMNTYLANRLTAAAAQLTSAATGYTSNTAWGAGNTSIQQDGTIQFASAVAAQYFFNQGGRIVFGPGTTPGAGTTQDTNWTNAINAFTYTLNAAEYSTLTGSPVNKYLTYFPAGVYSGNFIELAMLNAGGGAIYYTVKYQDAHVATGAGPDNVGTSGFTVTRFTSSGAVTGTAPTLSVRGTSQFV